MRNGDSSRNIGLLIVLSALVIAPARLAMGVIPGAKDPKCYTDHDRVKAVLAFNQRTLVEPYKQIGKRDPKWDEDAIKLLEGMSIRFANAGAR